MQKLLEQIKERLKKRKVTWSKFFKKWNKLGRNPEPDDKAIPIRYRTGRNAFFNKRKFPPVRRKLLIKKSRSGKIRKNKKSHGRKRSNVATNAINSVDEKAMQRLQGLESKEEESLSVADDHVANKYHEDSTGDVDEKENSAEFSLFLQSVLSLQKQLGNKLEEDELSPVLKKPRLHNRCAWEFKTDTDQHPDTPVKSKQDQRNGFEGKLSTSVQEQCMPNELDRQNSGLKADVAADESPSQHSPKSSNSQDQRNGFEGKLSTSLQEQCMPNELDRQNSGLKADVAADESLSQHSPKSSNSQDSRNGCEDKVLPSVSEENMCNGYDRPNSSLKIDVAADKSRSKHFHLAKSRDNRNGCKRKLLQSVPGESICKGLGRPNSSLKIDVTADNSPSKYSYPAKSQGQRNGYEGKLLTKVQEQCMPNELEGLNSGLKADVAADESLSQHSKSSNSQDNRKGCEDNILPSVSEENMCKVHDRANFSLKIDVAADKSCSKLSHLEKSRDNRKGCEDKILPSVSEESMCNVHDRANFSLKIDVAADKSRSKHSHLEKSRDQRNGCQDKLLANGQEQCLPNKLYGLKSGLIGEVVARESLSQDSKTSNYQDNRKGHEDRVLPSVSEENTCNGHDRPSSRLKIDVAADKSHSKHSRRSKSRDDTPLRKSSSSTLYNQTPVSSARKSSWRYVIVESDLSDAEE